MVERAICFCEAIDQSGELETTGLDWVFRYTRSVVAGEDSFPCRTLGRVMRTKAVGSAYRG